MITPDKKQNKLKADIELLYEILEILNEMGLWEIRDLVDNEIQIKNREVLNG